MFSASELIRQSCFLLPFGAWSLITKGEGNKNKKLFLQNWGCFFVILLFPSNFFNAILQCAWKYVDRNTAIVGVPLCWAWRHLRHDKGFLWFSVVLSLCACGGNYDLPKLLLLLTTLVCSLAVQQFYPGKSSFVEDGGCEMSHAELLCSHLRLLSLIVQSWDTHVLSLDLTWLCLVCCMVDGCYRVQTVV